MTPASIPESIADAPPSAKLVYRTLADTDSLSVSELTDQTALNQDTCRRALRRLEAADLVTYTRSSEDRRRREYSLCDE